MIISLGHLGGAVTLCLAAAHGLEPHMHVNDDRAVRTGLDAVAALRKRHPGRRIRAATGSDPIYFYVEGSSEKILTIGVDG